MELLNLLNDLEKNKNPEQAAAMSAYMRDQFQFLGIQKPHRKKLCNPYFKEAKKSEKVDWNFINTCWESPYREAQYAAAEYLGLMEKILTPSDIPKIKKLAVTKSWWDTVDNLDSIIGSILLSYPQQNELIIKWSTDQNIWLRRIAIDHQLLRKEKTDTALLETILVNNLGTDEFFINKAIGWSLREYSKTNPKWVTGFIKKYKDKMSSLSVREASKYL